MNGVPRAIFRRKTMKVSMITGLFLTCLLCGCPFNNGAFQGGDATITLTADGWPGLDDSEYGDILAEGTTTFDWGNSGQPDDGPGTTLGVDAYDDHRYSLSTSFGGAEMEEESGFLRVKLDGFRGAGHYDTSNVEEISFNWRGMQDFDTDEQATFRIWNVSDGECDIVIDEPNLGGSFDCTGIVPEIDEQPWAGQPFEFSGVWLVDPKPQT